MSISQYASNVANELTMISSLRYRRTEKRSKIGREARGRTRIEYVFSSCDNLLPEKLTYSDWLQVREKSAERSKSRKQTLPNLAMNLVSPDSFSVIDISGCYSY